VDIHDRQDDRSELTAAFRLFEAASDSLREEYALLRGEAARLRSEAVGKNALLARGIEEHQRWMRFLTTVLERIPGGIVVVDSSGGVVASNGNAERLMGLAAPPAPGTSLSSLGTAGEAVARAAERGGPAAAAVEGSRGEERRLKVSRIPLPPPAGDPEGHLIVLEDITDDRLLSERSERARRLASLEELAARIAHEIRNPLTSCRFFLAMAVQDVRGNERDGVLSNLSKLSGVLDSIDSSLSGMLGFVRNHRPACVPFDPEELVKECVEYAGPLVHERGIGITIENFVPGRKGFSDPVLLRQAILNIVLNAVQAMGGKDGGTLTVRIGRRNVRQGEEEAPYLKLSFRDTGPGIPEDVLPRIFDPFFTTRPDGTGLGLAIVQSIMLALDGFVEVESRPGAGTIFSLLLPDPGEDEREAA
jgi:signal transduction histidine kinase